MHSFPSSYLFFYTSIQHYISFLSVYLVYSSGASFNAYIKWRAQKYEYILYIPAYRTEPERSQDRNQLLGDFGGRMMMMMMMMACPSRGLQFRQQIVLYILLRAEFDCLIESHDSLRTACSSGRFIVGAISRIMWFKVLPNGSRNQNQNQTKRNEI